MTSIESEDLSNRPSLISLKKTKLKTFERRNASKPSIAAGELKRFEDVEDDTEEGEEEIVVALGSNNGRVTLLSYYNLIKLDKLIFKDRFEFDLKPLLNSSNNCSDKNSNVSIPRRRSNTSAKIHGLEICPNSINQRDSKRTSGLTRTNFKLIFCTSDHEIGIYRFDLKFVERWLLKLHRSAINDLISWKEEDGKDQTIRLITGSSTEVVLWDLTTEPICLGCFGRRMVPRNPYSPLMVRLETINNLCEQPRKLIAEFEDHSIASWDLRDIIPQHHHQQQQQQQVKKLRTTQPEVISGDRSKTGWAFSCCDDMAHRYQIDSEGTIRNLDSQADLANLLEPVELFVCLNCNHQTDEVDFLVLKRRTGEILTVRTKLSKKIGNSDEERFTIKLVKSNCSWFKFCKTEKILITKSSGKNELSLITKEQLILFDVNKSRSNSSGLMRRNSRIESRFHDEDMKESCGSIKSLTLDMIQGNQSDDYYTKITNLQEDLVNRQ
ncbi:hypothetical protein BY996DRAFT_4319432 [Phakopsora pachyrhizi]|nr:hypothetical protein BY996DRAFT_4319432 [Phakopsora pachyrhizi]